MNDIKMNQIAGDILIADNRESVLQDVETLMMSSTGMIACNPYIGLGITDSVSGPNINSTKNRLIKQAGEQGIVLGEIDYDFTTGDYNVEILSD